MAITHRLIPLIQRGDDRGTLTVGQIGDQLPFLVKRMFLLSGMSGEATRGDHAHRAQHQFLLVVQGSARVLIDNGSLKEFVTLNRRDQALYAPPMLWLKLSDFSRDCVCLVAASDVYDEADYIRDYSEFMRLARPT